MTGRASPQPIHFPESDARVAVSLDLGLSQEQHEFLWSRVSQIVQTISSHQRVHETGEVLSDKDRKAWLKSTISDFERLRHQLAARRSRTTEALLESTVLPALAELLGHHGLEVLSNGRSHFWLERPEVDDYVRGERVSQDRTFDLAVVDRQAQGQRVDAVIRDGQAILLSLLDRLSAPLKRRSTLEQMDRGGSPGRLYRNYAVQELVPIYETIFGEEPRSGPNSRFVLMCWEVLTAIGIEEKGLEDAVERLLNKRAKSVPK